MKDIHEDHPANKSRQKDESFDGLTRSRSCTDVIFLLIFIVFIIGYGILAFFSFYNGNPEILIYPTNSRGQLCGFNQTVDKEKLLLYDITKCLKLGPTALISGCPSTSVCTSECPKINWSWKNLHDEELIGRNDTKRNDEMICETGFVPGDSLLTIKELVESEKCAPYYLKSVNIFRRCIPLINENDTGLIETDDGDYIYNEKKTKLSYDDIKGSSGVFLDLFQIYEKIYQILGDMSTLWYVLLGIICVSGLSALLWCVLLRYFSSLMVYFTLCLFIIVFIGATSFCYYQYFFVAKIDATGTFVISDKLSTYFELKEFWLTLAIILSIITLIIVAIVMLLGSRIKMAIALIHYASKIIGNMVSLLFMPIIPLVLELSTLALLFSVSLCIMASGKKQFMYAKDEFSLDSINTTYVVTETIPNANKVHAYFTKYVSTRWSLAMHFYNFFVCIWMMTFIEGVSQISISGAVASWYWCLEKSKVGVLEPFRATWRCIRYHLGTVALGSLVITIVVVLRKILQFIENRAGPAKNVNVFATFILCCCKCMLWCLEKILRFITKNAFIMTAMTGDNFCTAAKDSFFLILRNCLRLLVVDNITGFILFTAKLIITALCGLGVYYGFEFVIIPNFKLAENSIELVYCSMAICMIGSFLVCSLFFNVFSFTVDTLFLCLMEDLERNDGSPEKPYVMSKSLMQAVCVKNEKQANQKC